MKIPTQIFLQGNHWQQMRSHAIQDAPLEACGLVGGKEWRSLEVFPTVNELQSPTRFRVEPQAQIRIFHLLEERGWELIGVYHSHPAGPDRPSQVDITESAYPEVINLIWYKKNNYWDCKGFIIESSRIHQIEIVIHK